MVRIFIRILVKTINFLLLNTIFKTQSKHSYFALFWLIKQMAEREEATEQLKENKHMKRFAQMNNIRSRVTETINNIKCFYLNNHFYFNKEFCLAI